MGPEAEELHRALVSAFPGYVRDRISHHGLPAVDDAVEEATAALDEQLRSLLSQAGREQARSPLQLVRDALLGPTGALHAAGAEPLARDEQQRRLLPWDDFALAPATSRELGEAVWHAHVAWGVAKAREVAGVVPAAAPSGPPLRPTVALLSTDLMDRSKIEGAAARAGYQLAVVRNPGAVADLLARGGVAMAFVDLAHAAADEAIRAFSAEGITTVAYGPHVDDVALARARSLGVMQAVARSRFFRDPDGYLPKIV